MAVIKPFKCIRPNKDVVSKVAALPYDVYNTEEARVVVGKEPLSFLKIDRAETQFPDGVSAYDSVVYEKAKEMFDGMIKDGTLLKDNMECYYIYELIMDSRQQTGIVATSSIDDYLDSTIKKHEKTREQKLQDRIKHVDALDAQTGPIFLAYRNNKVINNLIDNIKKRNPLYAFTADDGVIHNVWKVNAEVDINTITDNFKKIPNTYIADGHHRCESAVRVGVKRRKENPDYTGKEPFNFFLSVLFPDSELMILPYNRSVKDLNGLNKDLFFTKITENFTLGLVGKEPFTPKEKGQFGMYIDRKWYFLIAKEELQKIDDPVDGLDAAILQDYLFMPILGINDPRTDDRIDFIGGIRGVKELEKRANNDMMVSFSVYPTSIEELFNVADANLLMPPKSTWFEPKLRSGIFIHKIK